MSWFRRRPVDQSFWTQDSTPFSAQGDAPQPCQVVLRQIDDNDFSLQQPLVFTRPDRMRGGTGAELVLTRTWLAKTDLASIPGYLGWFVRRHGRHTPAALLHDFLIKKQDDPWPDDLPAEWQLEPAQADLLFRELLVVSNVPLVRAYVMWAGVTARTRWYSGWGRRIALVLWFLLALAGTAALGYALATLEWWLIAVALLAPLVGAVLWGGQFMAGVTGGYAFPLVVAGSLPAFLAYLVYQGVEWVALAIRRWRHRATPAKVESLPAPPTFSQR
jgi:hypothetical protein